MVELCYLIAMSVDGPDGALAASPDLAGEPVR
jgi:hypothetical protein